MMTAEDLKPLRIQNGLRIKFDIPSDEMPELSTVQNIVYNYAKTKLVSHARVQDITSLAREKVNPSWTEDENEYIMFKWSYDVDGNAGPGNGTDKKPFIVRVTTKSLLRRLDRRPGSFILHIDRSALVDSRTIQLQERDPEQKLQELLSRDALLRMTKRYCVSSCPAE
ncbi:hypothetical protein PF001_g16953 [Phytophthora fragariae]|uniref:Uncharacterized protein n=1 Tax=Phytophthora fragariae TaxID=53985 RepID=A0A6A3T4Q8_9STRA|nr:hypothetical protein PF009_g18805 [Phytophthora fragariae]KAE9126677.1 hypothetical protein PF006_g16676 [Phytophthora fragariae]KAE9296251.1 hypothetical protein PF001_g16953 [Phytophthora fragariae]